MSLSHHKPPRKNLQEMNHTIFLAFATSLQLRYFLVYVPCHICAYFFLKKLFVAYLKFECNQGLVFYLVFHTALLSSKKIRVLTKVKNYHTDGDWNITKAGRP